MAKKSIGQFIAALRKANGMTQQDIADRLYISNKAVSRWERDECSPDLSLIPALAEMLGVTCDELLRGERILESHTREHKEQRTEKQVKTLINRTLSGFKTLIYIALAVSVMGAILMFGISYGFYRPIIGFAVMLLFEVCSLAIAISAVTRVKDVKAYHEIFDKADRTQIQSFDHILGTRSFWAFYMIGASVMISLPLILFLDGKYVESVLSAEHYFTLFFSILVLLLAVIYLQYKEPYVTWITNGTFSYKRNTLTQKNHCLINRIQIGATMLAGVVFVLSAYLDTDPENIAIGYIIAIALAISLLLTNGVCFILLLTRRSDDPVTLRLTAFRNLCLLPSSLLILPLHSVAWSFEPYNYIHPTIYIRHDLWEPAYLFYALAYSMTVLLVFSLIRVWVDRKRKQD